MLILAVASAHKDSVVQIWDVRTASLIPLDVHMSTLVISGDTPGT